MRKNVPVKGGDEAQRSLEYVVMPIALLIKIVLVTCNCIALPYMALSVYVITVGADLPVNSCILESLTATSTRGASAS